MFAAHFVESVIVVNVRETKVRKAEPSTIPSELVEYQKTFRTQESHAIDLAYNVQRYDLSRQSRTPEPQGPRLSCLAMFQRSAS